MVDVTNVYDTDVIDSGSYLVYSIFYTVGSIITLIILVALIVLVINKFGLANILKLK